MSFDASGHRVTAKLNGSLALPASVGEHRHLPQVSDPRGRLPCNFTWIGLTESIS